VWGRAGTGLPSVALGARALGGAGGAQQLHLTGGAGRCREIQGCTGGGQQLHLMGDVWRYTEMQGEIHLARRAARRRLVRGQRALRRAALLAGGGGRGRGEGAGVGEGLG